MKKGTLAILPLALISCAGGPSKPEFPEFDGMTLIWNDEFDGDSLSEENWNMKSAEVAGEMLNSSITPRAKT